MIPQRISFLVSLLGWWCFQSYQQLLFSASTTHTWSLSVGSSRRPRSSRTDHENHGQSNRILREPQPRPSVITCLSSSRYGPPGDDEGPSSRRGPQEPDFDTKKTAYRNLLDSILKVTDVRHIPSLLTKNLELVLSLVGNDGAALIQSVLKDYQTSTSSTTNTTEVEEAIDLTLSFAENFVQEASQLEKQNKDLLGKILKVMSDKESGATTLEREIQLDALFAQERDRLTIGFIRHIENECERIQAAPTMTPDSARLLETLWIIQARAVEELGEDLGEAAQVMGQLIGYEDPAERQAVLEAGLTVRGVDFARELKVLSEQALEEFQGVLPSMVSPKAPEILPELTQIVQEIDDSLAAYLKDNSEFE